jgi:superfamily I DNA and/or RNA helicase
MLDTQYRMHPAISAFPSATFYNSDLKDGTVDPSGNVVQGFNIPQTPFLCDAQGRPTSMTFVNHDHPESPELKSIANHGETAIIASCIADLLANNPVRPSYSRPLPKCPLRHHAELTL